MRALCLLLLVLLVPLPASAATVEQIVALSKAGVSDSVIVALIDRDKTVFSLQPEDLVKLKQQGVSENVVLAMLRSGRADAEAAAQAEAETERNDYAAMANAGPTSVTIGHYPQWPNTFPYDPAYFPPLVVPYSNDFNPVPYAVPYVVPTAVSPVARPFRPLRHGPAPAAQQQFCTSQVRGAPSVAVLTMCPGDQQPHASRPR